MQITNSTMILSIVIFLLPVYFLWIKNRELKGSLVNLKLVKKSYEEKIDEQKKVIDSQKSNPDGILMAMNDAVQGGAILRVERVDPSSMYLRSPRER